MQLGRLPLCQLSYSRALTHSLSARTESAIREDEARIGYSSAASEQARIDLVLEPHRVHSTLSMTAERANTSWASVLSSAGPETVHLVPPSSGLLEDIRTAAETAGGRCFVVSVSGLSDARDLVHRIGRELRFPYQVDGFDALLSLLSDLTWLGSSGPFALVFDNADQMAAAQPTVFESLVEMLPNLSDRWQTRATPFHVVFVVSEEATAATVERTFAAEVERSAASPWHREVHQVRVRRAL